MSGGPASGGSQSCKYRMGWMSRLVRTTSRPGRPGEERTENLKGGLELFYFELSRNSDATHRSVRMAEYWDR